MKPIVVVGTGTGVGKTVFSVALLQASKRIGLPLRGWKPIETGGTEDADLLAAASPTSIPTTYAFRTPIAAHLAAAADERSVDLTEIVERARRHRAEPLLIETAGGLFSPLTMQGETNAELIVALGEISLLLVAPNRLGVLHDVTAVIRALRHTPLAVTALVLTGPRRPEDRSTESNASELARLHALHVFEMTGREVADADATRLLALLA